MSTVLERPSSRMRAAASPSASSVAASPDVPSTISPVGPSTIGGAGGAPAPGRWGPNAAGGASAGSGVATATDRPRGPMDPTAAALTAAGTAGWTSTSIVPPQARPTSQASSSLIP